MTTIMVRGAAAEDLVLCRSDAGCGGYSHIAIRGGVESLPGTKEEVRSLLQRRSFDPDLPVTAEVDEEDRYVIIGVDGLPLLSLVNEVADNRVQILRLEDYREENDDADDADLLHVHWRHWYSVDERGTSGLLAVKLEADRLDVRVLSGHDPNIHVLIPMLDNCFPSWRERAAELHGQRVNPWTVHCREGMSGCETYTLRSLRDADWGDAPSHASIHISMMSKFHGIYGLWLGDLLPLLAHIVPSKHMEGPAAVDLVIGYPWMDRHAPKWHREKDPSELLAAIDGWATG